MANRAKVAIVGDGNVGSALREGLTRAGYDAEAAGKEPQRLRQMARDADVVVLAVPYGERENAVTELRDELRGKVLVDVTNALAGEGQLAIDPNRESGAEQLQRMAPQAKVVKAFNTVFAQHMQSGQARGERLTALIASDDEDAKRATTRLARDIGFDAIDAGGLRNARWLEALGMLNITLGYTVGHGTDIGFRLVHEAKDDAKARAAPARQR